MPTQIEPSLGTMSKDEAQELVRGLRLRFNDPYSQAAAAHNPGELSEIFLRTGFYLVASGYGIPGKRIEHRSEFPCIETYERLNLEMVGLGPMLAECCAIAGIPLSSPFLKQLGMSPLSAEDSIQIDPGFRAYYNMYLWHYPCAATKDNLKLAAPWSRADAVLNPAEALPPEAVLTHTINKGGFEILIKIYGFVKSPSQLLLFISGGKST